MKYIKKLYDWVLSLADKSHGDLALFLLAFAESSCFPIPPDPLMIALILGNRKKFLWFAIICTAASVLGGILGYYIGYALWDLTQDFFFNYVPGFSPEAFDHIKTKYDKHSFLIVFTSGFTPIPYKLFTISSGVFKIPLAGFIIASIAGRASRFFLVACLIGKFGEKIKNFIDKYFNTLTIVFTILIILGFVVSKFILTH